MTPKHPFSNLRISRATAVLVDRSVHRRQKPLATDVALPELLAGVHGVRHAVGFHDLFCNDVELVPSLFVFATYDKRYYA